MTDDEAITKFETVAKAAELAITELVKLLPARPPLSVRVDYRIAPASPPEQVRPFVLRVVLRPERTTFVEREVVPPPTVSYGAVMQEAWRWWALGRGLPDGALLRDQPAETIDAFHDAFHAAGAVL